MLHYDTFVFSTSELISMQERQQHCAQYTVTVVNKNVNSPSMLVYKFIKRCILLQYRVHFWKHCVKINAQLV